MARLWIFSDLHAEQRLWTMPPSPPGVDVVIAAGDVDSPATRSVKRPAAMAGGIPVVFVPGNHEWYATRGHFGVDRETARARGGARPRRAHADGRGGGGRRRPLGATLWTDFAVNGTPEASMRLAERGMNDFRLIHPVEGGPRLRPEDTVAWHRASRSWLAARLAERREGPTVVVTHHLPHPSSVAPTYRGDGLNPAFCSDLSELVEGGGADLWIHGHTHTSRDYVVGGTRVLCNPKSYGPLTVGGRVENPAFDPALIVEV